VWTPDIVQKEQVLPSLVAKTKCRSIVAVYREITENIDIRSGNNTPNEMEDVVLKAVSR